MRFAKHLYLSEGMEKKKEKIVSRLCSGKLQKPVYVLAVANYGKERLEILSSLELWQREYPKEGLWIVGIAGDFDDALELVRQILEETYNTTGGQDLCAYIRDRDRDS